MARARAGRVGDLGVDLLRADDRHRDDRRARPERHLDESAAAETLQPVALREWLAGALHPLGNTITSSSRSSSDVALWGEAGTPPTLRMKAEMNGSTNAQSRTMNRGQRGSGCSRITAMVIIDASNGNSEPAWFATSSPRPCAGTLATPVASTRHHTSYKKRKIGNTASAKSSSKPQASSEYSPRSRREIVSTASRMTSGSEETAPLVAAHRIHPGLDPRADFAQKAASASTSSQASPAVGPLGSSPRPRQAAEERPRMKRRADAARLELRDQLPDRADRVVPRLEAQLAPHSPVVDAAPEAKHADRVGEQGTGAEPGAKTLDRGAEQGVRHRNRRPPAQPQDPAQ